MILSKVGFVTLGNKRGKISRLSPSFPLLLLYSSYYIFSFYGILSSSFPHCAMHCFMLRKQKDLNPHCNNNSNRDRHCRISLQSSYLALPPFPHEGQVSLLLFLELSALLQFLHIFQSASWQPNPLQSKLQILQQLMSLTMMMIVMVVVFKTNLQKGGK